MAGMRCGCVCTPRVNEDDQTCEMVIGPKWPHVHVSLATTNEGAVRGRSCGRVAAARIQDTQRLLASAPATLCYEAKQTQAGTHEEFVLAVVAARAAC